MSGGHYDYKCFSVYDMAQDIAADIIRLENGENTDRLSAGTLSRLRKCQRIIEIAGKLAHSVEWLMSGDYGDESFKAAVDPLLADVTLTGPSL